MSTYSELQDQYVAISELSSINIDTFTDNDEILVTRRDLTTEDDKSGPIYISYKANLNGIINSMHENIANHFKTQYYDKGLHIFQACKDNIDALSIQLTSEYDKLSTHYYISATLSDGSEISGIYPHYKQLSSSLCSTIASKMNEMDKLCVNLCNEVSTFINNASCQITSFEKTLSTNLCVWLNNSIQDLYKWIRNNFVDLTSSQRITGQKTFVRDIVGTALSAKWI